MWSPSDLDFSNERTASIFLLSSWHELFHAFTPDSNQPRLHNVPSLIDELAGIAEQWRLNSRYQSHAQKVQQELRQAIRKEANILVAIPEFNSRTEQLADETSPEAIVAACKILQGQTEEYHDAFLSLAKDSIQGLPDKKDQPHQWIRRLATLAFQRGKEDNDVWDPIEKDVTADHNDIFESLVSLTMSEDKCYDCTLAVPAFPEIHAAVRISGLQPVATSVLPPKYLKHFIEPTKRYIFSKNVVQASSIRHAVAASRKKMGIATGLVSLYQNSSVPVHPIALVVEDGRQIVFSQSEQAFRRLHPRKNPKKDIGDAIGHLDDQVEDRLLGTIELLSLASASSDARSRLINFWSSLETLAGAHEGETTLERVSALIVPLVISRHVGRSTRYLAIASQQLGGALSCDNFGSGFPKSTAKYVAPTEMLKTLASQEDSAPIKDLFAFAKHPLLRFRIHRSWKTYHDPKALLKMLKASRDALHWHLARIYRARNLLVHQGIESPFLVPLLDNLQNYISMAVQRLVHELKTHHNWSVRDAMAFWQGRMNYQLTSLDRSPASLSPADFIDTADRQPLWPA